MTRLFVFLLSVLAVTPAWPNATSAQNVNSRYTVESVELSKGPLTRLSRGLRKDLERLVGRKFDQELALQIARRVRRELHVSDVTPRAVRGSQPEHVKLVFDENGRRLEQEPNITKLAYHSKQGWTGGVEATFEAAGNDLTFGVQSDADELLERYAGLNMRFARGIGERVRLRFDFQTFHQQWNRTTVEAAGGLESIYRTRDAYAPSIAVLLAPGVTVTAGLSFNHIEFQYPAARTEAANAVASTLRYRKRWDGDSQHRELEAGYDLRAATKMFDSDFVYTRHFATARYLHGFGHNTVLVEFTGGAIGDRAPLFERFAAGNTQTLRGWNKFDLAPLGGARIAHGTVEYRHRKFAVFYDTGSVWDEGADPVARHSAGAGFHWDNIALSVAFPIRESRVVPIFLLSAYF